MRAHASVDMRDPFLRVSVAKPGDRLPDDGHVVEQFALVLDSQESDVVAITGSVARLRRLLVHLSQLLDAAEQAHGLTAGPWSHQLTRAQREACRELLLGAAFGNDAFNAMLWGPGGTDGPEPVWDISGMEADFVVIAYRPATPDVVVRRRSDGATGTLQFTNRPRFFYGWEPAEVTITPVAG